MRRFVKVLIVILFFLGALFATNLLLTQANIDNVYTVLFAQSGVRTIFALVILMLIGKEDLLPSEALNVKSENLRMGIAIYLFMIFKIIVVAVLSHQLMQTNQFEFNPLMVLYIFIFCMSIGFVEEFVFRGYAFVALMKPPQGWSAHTAAYVSSLLFAIPHMISKSMVENVGQLVSIFGLGLYFCGIYYRTKNLTHISILHGLFDFFSLIVVAFMPDLLYRNLADILKVVSPQDMGNNQALPVLIVIGLLFAFLGNRQLNQANDWKDTVLDHRKKGPWTKRSLH